MGIAVPRPTSETFAGAVPVDPVKRRPLKLHEREAAHEWNCLPRGWEGDPLTTIIGSFPYADFPVLNLAILLRTPYLGKLAAELLAMLVGIHRQVRQHYTTRDANCRPSRISC